MKNEKYHTDETISKWNRKIANRGQSRNTWLLTFLVLYRYFNKTWQA